MPVPVPPSRAVAERGLRRQAIVEAVLSAVFRGQLRPGEHLVTQQLAVQFGVPAPGVLAPVAFAEQDVWRLRPAMVAMAHVPFDRQPILAIGADVVAGKSRW